MPSRAANPGRGGTIMKEYYIITISRKTNEGYVGIQYGQMERESLTNRQMKNALRKAIGDKMRHLPDDVVPETYDMYVLSVLNGYGRYIEVERLYDYDYKK
jgi:hypothetical protein